VTRCIVNVATGQHYTKGQRRLREAVNDQVMFWTDSLPPGSPTHEAAPYAFKAFGLQAAANAGYDLLLWVDCCIVPIRSLGPLWDLIETQGYWFSRNGFSNHEWTCKEAYPLLGITEEENKLIEHVVAGAFGLNLRSETGTAFLAEYLRLAQTDAFKGPWTGGIGVQHRHDQSCASVIAHRLGMHLTNPPAWFSYPPGDEGTVLLADGAY
jgi:hypothetical protein